MQVSDVKREYQLQGWSGMLRECKESGLTVKDWCAERGIPEHAYYYRLPLMAWCWASFFVMFEPGGDSHCGLGKISQM